MQSSSVSHLREFERACEILGSACCVVGHAAPVHHQGHKVGATPATAASITEANGKAECLMSQSYRLSKSTGIASS